MYTEKAIRQILTTGFLTTKESKEHWKKTKRRISCGVQTLSKQPSKHVSGVYPIYLETGRGCYVGDNEGHRWIDYPCALGAILLGYKYDTVDNAVKDQIDYGTLFSLPSYIETELADKIIKLIPSAEKVRFLKTGSEVTSAAIRIARAFTGRDHIAYCGYHGWHDWYTADTDKNNGIPKCYKKLIHKFEYNNIDSLYKILSKYKHKVAAVIMEPYIYNKPENGFLEKVQELCVYNGALLIFDEIVTGFRTPKFSAQKYYKVIPDLSTFGKGMGNSYPISCVCGKKEIMDVLETDTFVSSTHGGDLVGIAASLATIRVLEDDDAIDAIWTNGTYLRDGYNEIAKKLGINTSCIGHPCRTMFVFPTGAHKSLFWQECFRYGILFGYAQFISYSHRLPEIEYTLSIIKGALEIVKANWKNPKKALDGKEAEETFRLVK